MNFIFHTREREKGRNLSEIKCN